MLTKFSIKKKKDVKMALPLGKRAEQYYFKDCGREKQVAEIGRDKWCFKISDTFYFFSWVVGTIFIFFNVDSS